MRSILVFATLLAALPLTAQTRPVIGVGLSVGTMGLGIDGAVQLAPRIGVRARVAGIPSEPKLTFDDIEYEIQFPTQIGLFADVFLVGPLRLTGGLRYSAKDFSVTGLIPGSITIGDSTYTGAQIGNFTGTLVTKKMAPYVGLGVGRVAGRGIGFFLDAGVAFIGTPRLAFAASGPIASQAAFQAELAQEQASANVDIEKYAYYPVIALGLRFGF